ncbi:MAG TPA: PilZ domain-containing protein [Terriglobales bacterium]|nr:PilZ domain-containing protein [Terriglobales bacterium]
MPDSRTGKRFDLKLPVSINPADSVQKLEGTTDNLSVGGVYLRADASFEVGTKVNFEITLPAEATGGPSDVKIQCRGTVVRTEHDEHGGQTGVACVIDGYEFVRT